MYKLMGLEEYALARERSGEAIKKDMERAPLAVPPVSQLASIRRVQWSSADVYVDVAGQVAMEVEQ